MHGLDVAASFREARDGNDAARVTEELSSAWVAFAQTGNPSTPTLPQWPTFEATKRATLIFETATRLENDPRAEIRKFWEHSTASPRDLGNVEGDS